MQRSLELLEALAFLVDHGDGGVLHEVRLAELGLDLADLTFDTRDLLRQTPLLRIEVYQTGERYQEPGPVQHSGSGGGRHFARVEDAHRFETRQELQIGLR